jgi:uncharacterized protein DUF3854
MYGPTGQLVSHQWKPRRPVRNRDGKPMKYASPKGCPNRLDVHPRNVAAMPDPTVELWVTEGIKKADALTSRGLCAIAITGVYNWRSQHGTLGERIERIETASLICERHWPVTVLWTLRRAGRPERRCCCSCLASTPPDCTNSDL